MSYDTFIFIINRVSLVFLLSFVYAFSPFKYKTGKTVSVLALCYVIVSCIDATPLIWEHSRNVIFFEIILIQTTVLFISKYRDWRALYVGTLSSIYVLVGDTVCNIFYQKTNIFWLSVLIQLLIHTTILLLMVKLTRKELLAQLEEKSMNWLLLLMLPALFYLTLISLGEPGSATVTVRDENYVPAILLLILMNVANIVCMRFLSARMRAHKQEKENLFFETYTEGLKNNISVFRNQTVKTQSCVTI